MAKRRKPPVPPHAAPVRRPVPRAVSGRVLDQSGRPLAGVTVRALNKSLRAETPLGDAATSDSLGRYRITYAPAPADVARRGEVNLLVRVVDRKGATIGESSVVFSARDKETIELRVPSAEGRQSEFDRYRAQIAPLLQKVQVSALAHSDVSFIAGKTAIPELRVAWLVIADQHSASTRVPAEVFYGLFRQDLPTNLAALVLQRPEALEAALRQSVADNVVAASLEPRIAPLVADIHRLLTPQTIGAGQPATSFAALMKTAGLSAAQQQTVASAVAGHDGDAESLWIRLRDSMPAASIDALQDVLRLGLITGNNAPLISSLQKQGVRSPRDLATLAPAALRAMINAPEVLALVPSLMDGETDAAKAERVAGEVLEIAKAAFPASFLRVRLAADANQARRDAARILQNVPAFELRDERVDDLLRQPNALTGVGDRDGAITVLKQAQRLLRVTATPDAAASLLSAGLGSARDIAGLSRQAFADQFGEAFGGGEQAMAYHAKAQQISATVSSFAAMATAARDFLPSVIRGDGPQPAADFTTLFGSYSLCECDDCRSVYSPAAYLVDLLQFINPKSGVKPLTTLRQRRPDIEHIPLTCENTNTPMPYVDLVLEILEFYVANGELTAAAARDTGGTPAADLAVAPQFTIDAAYQVLQDAVYPPSLPFHRALETARAHLAHLGTSLEAVMRTFQRNGIPDAAAIDRESLGLSPLEWDILTAASAHALPELFGAAPNTAESVWMANLRTVSGFLQRTELTYDELVALLATQFINGDDAVHLADRGNPPACDLTNTDIVGFDAAWLSRIHRFVRLMRALGWTPAELDASLRTLQQADITAELLRGVAAIHRLTKMLKLGVLPLLAFWGDLDPAEFRRVFQSKTVRNPPDAAFDLDAAGTALQNGGHTLAEKTPALLAALRLSADDLSLLRGDAQLQADDAPMTIGTLSALYRRATLLRALQLRAKEFASLRALTGDDPFQTATPGSTEAFVARVARIVAAPFSVAELDYLYRDVSDPARPLAPLPSAVDGVLQQLVGGLARIAGEQANAPAGELAAKTQGFIVQTLSDAAAVDSSTSALLLRDILTSVADPSQPAVADFERLVGTGLTAAYFQNLDLTGAQATGTVATLDVDWSGTASPDPMIDGSSFSARWTGALLAPEAGTYTLALRVMGGARLWIDGQLVIDHWTEPSAIVEHSTSVVMTPAVPVAIAIEYRKSGNRGLAELRWHTASAPKQIVPQSRLFPDQAFSFELSRRAFRRLHKAALLSNRFKITDAEWRYLAAHPDDFGGFDPNGLPLEAGQFSTALFDQWERLRALFELRDRIPQVEASLVDVFAAGSRDAAIDVLARASGWDRAQIELVAGPGGLNLADSDFKSEIRLVDVAGCLMPAARLGVGCDRLFAWAAAPPASGAAQEVVDAAKAKYDPDAWRAVAKPINDVLRDARRTSLVAHLVASDDLRQRGITNANQLFEFFLIDIEMEPCMVTSRIKQAISSVQLFIQRCLMNLEGLAPSVVDAEVWEWMRNYRVWEANRKVFLYPENWIEPGLRDDKTPFFQGLESQLLQGDLNAATAEHAFLAYLEKLDQVGRLDIVGLHTQTATEHGSARTTVHVIGRTTNAPHAYYYRQLADQVWSPWIKIDVDFEGDILIPVVFNRRLYVYWPHFEEKPSSDQELPAPYMQSLEHWRWEHDLPAWTQDHEDWATRKALHDGWAAVKSTLQAANAGRDEDDQLGIPPEPELPGEEPARPEEPAYSTPPALKHQEIRLSWTEFRDGTWSPKQTSDEPVISPFATQTLKDYGFSIAGIAGEAVLGLIHAEFPLAKGDQIGGTIVDVYTPAPNEHFFRTQIEEDSGDLIVRVYRRYERRYRVLDMNSTVAKAFDRLGHFRVVCGSMVRAFSKVTAQEYDSLPRPDGFSNRAMALVNESGAEALTMKSNGKTLEVLRALPDGSADATVQPGHEKPFALTAQRFCYRDRRKSYFAHHRPARPLTMLTAIDRVPAVLTYAADAPLASAIREVQTRQVAAGVDERRGLLGGEMLQAGRATAGAALRTDALSATPAIKLTTAVAGSIVASTGGSALQFETFFHPHLCEFRKRLDREGVPGLLARAVQLLDNDASNARKNVFVDLYRPAPIVSQVYPREDVDFGGGAYSVYNWELFFHAPILIATSLARNQRFAEAREWFHYVFNPTTDSALAAPQRYWNIRPFFENTHPEQDQIQNLLAALGSDRPGDAVLADRVRRQIQAWSQDPFNPHHIARMRITAYQKHVVMKYIDNLIQWGDQLFSQNTIETINEATLLYVLAQNILGPRPTPITSHIRIEPKTYAQLKAQPGGLDDFSNALVAFENEVPYIDVMPPTPYRLDLRPLPMQLGKRTHAPAPAAPALQSAAETFYFGIPPNTGMLKYWDTVADRLFKIRHCMNIEGLVQQLPLFEPPIDPALLVKAKAAGLDIGSVLADVTAPPPAFRFSVMVEKAGALANELRSLSAALLAALEKRDGEHLAAIRTASETALLKAVRNVREQQIDEASQTLEGLRRTRIVVETRRDFYRDIARISAAEQSNMDNLAVAHVFSEVSQGLQAAVSAAHVIPNFDVGTAGWAASPVVKSSFGGNNLGSAATALAQVSAMIAAQFTHDAQMASIKGGYDRRWNDWKLQERVAEKELNQIDRQIAAAEIRSAITASELANQDLQIASSQRMEELLRTKYTNEDLYVWMIGQVSQVYFQAYQLAYGLAKRAERAFQIERGLTTSSFVQFGYWDSLRKGLLAGDQLGLDLRRMESAYLEQNRRDYEITKQVSLASLDPMALLGLKETGQCQFALPEQLFDMDYPGHYLRRIKSVALTIPCVVGPYTSVNATLTLLSSETRASGISQRPYPKDQGEDPRFVVSFAAQQAIAASHAQNDSGLFELNFRDDRYLPFENAGAVSTWRLELTNDFRSFDFDTISDVVMHLRYTAREGGAALKANAVAAVTAWLGDAAAQPLARSFSARHEFPTEWYRFLNPSGPAATQDLVLDLSASRFPFPFQRSPITITAFHVFFKLKEGFSYADGSGTIRFDLTRGGGTTSADNEFAIAGSPIAGLPHAARIMEEGPATWTVTVRETALAVLAGPNAALRSTVTVDGVDHQRLNVAAIDDLWVVVVYRVG